MTPLKYAPDRNRHERHMILWLLEEPENWIPDYKKIKEKSGLGLATVRSKIKNIMQSKITRINHKIRVEINENNQR